LRAGMCFKSNFEKSRPQSSFFRPKRIRNRPEACDMYV
jgi:hypothetical protein